MHNLTGRQPNRRPRPRTLQSARRVVAIQCIRDRVVQHRVDTGGEGGAFDGRLGPGDGLPRADFLAVVVRVLRCLEAVNQVGGLPGEFGAVRLRGERATGEGQSEGGGEQQPGAERAGGPGDKLALRVSSEKPKHRSRP